MSTHRRGHRVLQSPAERLATTLGEDSACIQGLLSCHRGIENHIPNLAEAQVRNGHEVSVLVTRRTGQGRLEEINGVSIIRVPRLVTLASKPLSPAFPFALQKQSPDITHLHFPYPVGEVSQWLAGMHRPYVITYHSDVVRQKRILRLYEPLMMHILRKAQGIITTSDRYIHSSPYLSRISDKCRAVPLGVDTSRFHNVDKGLICSHQATVLPCSFWDVTATTRVSADSSAFFRISRLGC